MDPSQVPWQASLGVAGVAVAGLVGLLVWLNRQFVSGKFLTIEQHTKTTDELTKGHATVITALNAQHDLAMAGEKVRGDEWKETALVEREGRTVQTEIAKSAVETNRAVDYVLSQFFPKVSPSTPNEGDNVVREVAAS